MLVVAWAESAEQGMTPGETWTCTVVLNLDTVHQQNNTAPGSEKEERSRLADAQLQDATADTLFTAAILHEYIHTRTF